MLIEELKELIMRPVIPPTVPRLRPIMPPPRPIKTLLSAFVYFYFFNQIDFLTIGLWMNKILCW